MDQNLSDEQRALNEKIEEHYRKAVAKVFETNEISNQVLGVILIRIAQRLETISDQLKHR